MNLTVNNTQTEESIIVTRVQERPRKIKISLSRNSRRITRVVRKRVSRTKIEMITNQQIKPKPFICQVEKCKYAGTREHYLNRHMLKHEKEKLYPCKLCSKQFLTSKSLYQHAFDHYKDIDESDKNREKPTEEKTSKIKKERSGMFTCKYCPKKFRLQYKLQEHQAVHEQSSS